MANTDRQLLTIGVFLVVIFVAIVLAVSTIIDWINTVPFCLLLFGGWMLVLAELQRSNPEKYAQSAFSSLQLGLLLAGIGGAWFLFAYNWLYSIAVLVLVFGLIAITTALHHGKKIE